ncbi:MAG TPA: hypothetical protein VMR96_07560 [Solirubrobacterales bacterium]|nr:hypothetical protein [Solirubrobacterales bacterium]
MSKGGKASGEALVESLLKGKEVGKIGDAGASAIAATAAAEKLRTLSLRFAGVGPKGAAALADSTHLKNLESLDLEGNEIGDDGAEALATSSYLGSLRSLQLGHSGFGERGLAARNSIGPKGAAAIARSRSMAKLEHLGLPLYRIDGALAMALSRSPLERFFFISPGALESSRASPDGRWTARVDAQAEVWPDGPRSGTLEVGELHLEDASPSTVWSHDGSALAALQWIRGKEGFTGKGRLVVIRPGSEPVKIPGEHGALALFAYDGQTLSAFDASQPERADLELDASAGH